METIEKNANSAIVYLAYGLASSKYQVIISILTLYHHVRTKKNDLLFVIYTDSEREILDRYLVGLPVKLEILSKEQVKTFRGEDGYMFRLKPLIIKDFFLKYKRNILYLDSDTFFMRNPTGMINSVSAGQTIMNAKEYNLIDGGEVETLHWFNLRQGLKQHKYVINGEIVSIPLATMMWNSGVIGISYEDSPLIDQVVSLIDQIYSRCNVFNVEQFVTSYILHTNTQLRSSEDYIDHYWHKSVKNTFNQRIPSFLEENISKTGQELYDSAFDFAKEVRTIYTPYRESIMVRISARIKAIVLVARKGYI